MAIIQTYITEIDINGYIYDIHVKYVQESDGFIEIRGVFIINDDDERVDFPYLVPVEQDILEEIKESYR